MEFSEKRIHRQRNNFPGGRSRLKLHMREMGRNLARFGLQIQ